jgi:hypothetical protein
MKRHALAFKVLARVPAGLCAAVLFTGVMGVNIVMPRTAFADPESPPPAPIDVAVKTEPPPRRVVSLEWNPIALLYRRVSVNVEIAPADHHVLILSPYYFYSQTAAFETSPDAAGNSVQVPSQRFEGFGGEIGYRYYTGLGGPRGFFVGPSLILASVQCKAGNGATTSLADYGVAFDVGYQMLVANNWAIALGVGAEYTWASKSLPDQQWPANIYANSGFHARPLFALGYAF